MANELLEAKVQISGTEEAVTEFGQAQQRMVQAAESLGTGEAVEKIEVDRILQQAGLGPIQDIRRYTERCRVEIDDILKDWREVQKENDGVDRGPHAPGGRAQRSRWLKKIRGMLGTAARKIHVTPEQIAADVGKVAGSLVGMLTPGVIGVGGILGLMLWGVAETQKYEAEANRFAQIFEESVRTYSHKAEAVDRMAAGKLASVAKSLELQFGATRAELEAVARAYSDMGISAGEQAEKVTKAYGTQMQTLYGLTLGLERHFELAGGTAARQASEFMLKYGYDTKEAAEAVVQLNFAGARSGVGIATFSNAIQQATAGVRHMGINTSEVIGLTEKLTKQYESLGLTKHFAGAEALQATQQILGGLASFGMGEQVMLAERLGMGKGLEARATLLNQLTREGGPDQQVLTRSITELRAMALEMSRGDPQTARYWLESRMGFKGAKAIMDIGDKLAGGLSVEQLSKEEKKALSEAFKTEAQKTEEFQKFMRQALDGMRQVGLALFNILTAGFAEAILSIRMTIAILKGDTIAAGAYSKAMQETFQIFPEAIGQAVEGLGQVGKAAGGLFDVEGLRVVKKSLEGITLPYEAAGQEVAQIGQTIMSAVPEPLRPAVERVGEAIKEHGPAVGSGAVAGLATAAIPFGPLVMGVLGAGVAGKGTAELTSQAVSGSATIVADAGKLLTGGQRNARARRGARTP